MENIDVEELINAVHDRSCLWDQCSTHYRDKRYKKNSWSEVAQIVYRNYNDKTEEEKAQIEASLLSRWRNLRDAYARHIRTTAMEQTLSKSRLVKPYLYERQMQFLNSVITPRSKTDYIAFTNNSKQIMNGSNNQNSSLRKIRKNSSDQKIMKCSPSVSRIDPANTSTILQTSTTDQDSIENDDMSFFKSLLPIVRTLDSNKKLSFRIQVMKLLTSYTRTSTIKIIDSDENNSN